MHTYVQHGRRYEGQIVPRPVQDSEYFEGRGRRHINYGDSRIVADVILLSTSYVATAALEMDKRRRHHD